MGISLPPFKGGPAVIIGGVDGGLDGRVGRGPGRSVLDAGDIVLVDIPHAGTCGAAQRGGDQAIAVIAIMLLYLTVWSLMPSIDTAVVCFCI